MNNEFETRKFDIEEISKSVQDKDFSCNPTGENFKNSLENSTQKRTTENYHKKSNKPLIVTVCCTVLLLLVSLSLFLFSNNNNEFYESDSLQENIEDTTEEMPVSKDTDSENKAEENIDDSNTKVVCPYKENVGNYIVTSSSDVGEMSYSVYISHISDDGDIIFSVALMNTDVSVMYETGSIKGTLQDNKIEFPWTDNHGNSGTGELTLLKNAVSIMLTQKVTSEENTASLDTGTPLTIAKVN